MYVNSKIEKLCRCFDLHERKKKFIDKAVLLKSLCLHNVEIKKYIYLKDLD